MNADSAPAVMRPIADCGVLVEFGERIDDAVHEQVLNLDAAVTQAQLPGVTEMIPSYTALFVGYDPLVTDFASVCESLNEQLCNHPANAAGNDRHKPAHWKIPACYSERFAPDLAEVAAQTGLSTEQVVQQHCSGSYKVYMYGFAPGFAYMGGVPEPIQLARKTAPVMNVAPGSLIIAGPQALITTVRMPSGWWNIGRAGKTPLQDDKDRPFLFAVGDTVEFIQVAEADFPASGGSDL